MAEEIVRDRKFLRQQIGALIQEYFDLHDEDDDQTFTTGWVVIAEGVLVNDPHQSRTTYFNADNQRFIVTHGLISYAKARSDDRCVTLDKE